MEKSGSSLCFSRDTWPRIRETAIQTTKSLQPHLKLNVSRPSVSNLADAVHHELALRHMKCKNRQRVTWCQTFPLHNISITVNRTGQHFERKSS